MIKYFCLVSVLFFALPAWALNGEEVMEKVYEQSRQHKTQQFDIFMEIFDEQNRKRERFFTSWKKIYPDETRSLVKFYKPADIKNTALLSHSPDDQVGADQWIFLPAFKSTKKLSANDKRNSFMGSDFSNSDVAGRSLADDKHELTKEDDKNYHILSKPVDPEDAYSKLEYRIHKDIFVPLEVKFYDKDGELLKTLKNSKVQKVKGMYVVVDARMINAKGGYTNLLVRDIEVGQKINDSRFTTKGLRL